MSFGSKSKTQNETSTNVSNKETTLATNDNRVAENGHIGGNVAVGEAGRDVNVTTTDHGAIAQAGQMNLAAMDFGSDALESMGGVSREAIMSNQDVAESAIDFSGDAIRDSLGFGRDSLDFGRDAMYEVSDANERALEFGESAMFEMSDNAERAFGFGSSAMDAMEDSNRHTVDTLADSFKFWNQQTSQNVDRSLAFADRANRSEGAAVLESGLKTVAVVGGIIGGTMVLREWSK